MKIQELQNHKLKIEDFYSDDLGEYLKKFNLYLKLEAKVILDHEKKLWVVVGKEIDYFFDNSKFRIGGISRFRAQPIDSFRNLIKIFQKITFEDASWKCKNCGQDNNSAFLSDSISPIKIDKRVDCAKCKSYHWPQIQNNIIIFDTKRPR